MNLHFDPADLVPLVQAVVSETLAQRDAIESRMGGRIGYTEAEAADLLGVERHTLRDCRLRGEIAARKVGKRYVYSKQSLLAFLDEVDA